MLSKWFTNSLFSVCTSTINTGSIPNLGTCYTVWYLLIYHKLQLWIKSFIYSIHNDAHDRRNRVFLILQKEECTAQGGSQQGNCAMGLYIYAPYYLFINCTIF